MTQKNLNIAVIHGPNLNLLGKREPEIYGSTNLTQINNDLSKLQSTHKVSLSFFQSNHEGALVDHIQTLENYDGVVINPAAYTHTSVAILDALLAMKLPFVEVHLSDPKSREDFRHKSFYSEKAIAVVSGLGAKSYETGLEKLIDHLRGAQ
ncbi:MAG: type II 3-dehydroquinate dehydratase [Deltaproteobacteria bacterium]|nr:type II 3-dehydroquinate dehydratase [Deltaproteobacteria bacterium]